MQACILHVSPPPTCYNFFNTVSFFFKTNFTLHYKYKTSVPTSQKTQNASIRKINPLILFIVILAVCC